MTATSADQLERVAVERLVPNPDNPRTVHDGYAELAASIQAVGLQQPLIVEPVGGGDQLIVVAGHRSVPMSGRRLPDDWMARARCRGLSHLFVPADPDDHDAGMAAAICEDCPVLDECTDFAIFDFPVDVPYIVLAGMTTPRRRALRQHLTEVPA